MVSFLYRCLVALLKAFLEIFCFLKHFAAPFPLSSFLDGPKIS
jgi:hypothetical protein